MVDSSFFPERDLDTIMPGEGACCSFISEMGVSGCMRWGFIPQWDDFQPRIPQVESTKASEASRSGHLKQGTLPRRVMIDDWRCELGLHGRRPDSRVTLTTNIEYDGIIRRLGRG